MKNILTISLIGNINSGKSSLINALFKQEKAATSPVGGKTKGSTAYEYAISFNGQRIHIIDTPGMSEANAKERSEMWVSEAKSSDLIFFVTCSDLTDNEFKALNYLSEIGKPIVLILNQIDRYSKNQLEELKISIKEKIETFIDLENFVQVASAPIKRVCIQKDDGSEEWIEKYLDSDIKNLTNRMFSILEKEGKELSDLNDFLSNFEGLDLKKMKDIEKIKKEVEKTVEEFAVATGIAIALNPIPFVDLLASLGSFAVLVNKIGDHYGTSLKGDVLEVYAGSLLKAGIDQLKTYLVVAFGAALLKNIPFVGWAAGATVQGGVVGYLVYVLGMATSEYFANGKQWKEGQDMRKTLEGIISRTDKDTFSKKISDKIKSKIDAA
ncbi:MAG: DUF697 domain-containing protein [Bacteriovoracaceae bacterium]